MRIETGSYEIFSTGTILTVPGEPIDFIMDDDPLFIIRFEFQNEEGDKTRIAAGALEGKNGVKLIFYNYDSPAGLGLTNPIEVFDYRERTFALSFIVYSPYPQGSKILHFTWLVKKGQA